MADLVIGVSATPVAGATVRRVIAAGAIGVGGWVQQQADGQYALAANTSEVLAAATGMALSQARGAGQPIDIITAGKLEADTVVAVGTVYVLSSTLGVCAPDADVGSGAWVTTCAVGVTTSRLELIVRAFGVQRA